MYYLDTSYITPLLLEEPTSRAIEAHLAKLPADTLHISQWTRVEFASLIAREVRMEGLTEKQATEILTQFDEMVEESFHVLLPGAEDYELARNYVSRFKTSLRGGDALHLAIAHNQGKLTVLTLDNGLLKAAQMLKIKATRGVAG